MTFNPSPNKSVTLDNLGLPMLIGKSPEGFEYEEDLLLVSLKIFGIPSSYYVSLKWTYS